MNRRQRSLLLHVTVVALVTVSLVLGVINIRDRLTKSEAMRAMTEIGRNILDYRQQRGTLPPESWLGPVKKRFARLGDLQYRARWIDLQAGPGSILAHSKRQFKTPFLSDGYVVLTLDGQVKWMDEQDFEQLLAKQQGEQELKLLRENLGEGF